MIYIFKSFSTVVNIALRVVATVGFARFAVQFIQIGNMQRRPERLELLFAKHRFTSFKVEGFCSEFSGFGVRFYFGYRI